MWRIIEDYKVKQLFTAPTAVRIVKKLDYEGKLVKNYDVSTLKGFHLAGERCDPDTILWIQQHFPDVAINDNWWQTETGWPICSNFLNMEKFKKVMPTIPGSVTRPVPGY